MSLIGFSFKVLSGFAAIAVLFISPFFAGCNCNSQMAECCDVEALNADIIETYILGKGDKISVKFFYKNDLNEDLTIRPDGKISLQLIGDIQAAGHTPSELDKLITEKYSMFFDSKDHSEQPSGSLEPEVAVIVRDSVSQKVYVGGEINRPSMIKFSGSLRLLEATILAGGARDTAELDKVTIIRYTGDSTPGVCMVSLKKIAKGETEDISLRPYDVIYLPKTGIAEVGWVSSQFIHGLIPIQFTAIYNVKDTTVDVR